MKTSEAGAKHNKWNKICINLTRISPRNYSGSLDLNNIWDKHFRATVKPLFSSKIKSTENIDLRENGKLVKDEEEAINKSVYPNGQSFFKKLKLEI